MPLELFYQIVELYNAEITRLNEALANALADDEADEQIIADANAKAEQWQQFAEQIKIAFEEYKAQDIAEDEQLVNAMTEVKNRLQPA